MLEKPIGQKSIIINDKEYYITPHPDAPLMSDPIKAQAAMEDLMRSLSSGTAKAAEELELMRQFALVNMFFCLRYIFGAFGPYDQMTDSLHLEMCNWRQSSYCMAPGSRHMALLGRGHYKSTVLTHGADSWEALRNPNIRIRLVNALTDRAQTFVSIAMSNFTKNPLCNLLFPAYKMNAKSKHFILPNRTRYYPEDTIQVGGMEGAAEGDHHNLIDIDDPIGLNDLKGDRSAGNSIETKRNWYKTNSKALLTDWHTDRIGIKGTRYAVGDFYEDMWEDAKTLQGYFHPSMKLKENGHFNVYYRHIIENGKMVFGEKFSEEGYQELLEADPWTALTQMANDPVATGLSELQKYQPKTCEFIQNDSGLYIKRYCDDIESFNTGNHYEIINLDDCDVVLGMDPAASDEKKSTATCRSALEVWAMDKNENAYLLWSTYGFLNIFEIFSAIFEAVEIFRGCIRSVLFEINAFQKVMIPLFEKECEVRGIFVPFTEIYTGTNKISRIRSTVGRHLMKGLVYLDKLNQEDFIAEKNVFPQQRNRMDFLDAAEKVIRALVKPDDNVAYTQYEEEQEEEYAMTVDGIAGY